MTENNAHAAITQKDTRTKKIRERIGAVVLAASNALAKSAAKRTAEYRYYADLFKDSKKKYRG
jgi:hypothetical protein